MNKTAFSFPPFAFAKRERAALTSQLEGLAALLASVDKSNSKHSALVSRREVLQGKITELEDGKGDPAAAAAKLPALREELALVTRQIEQGADSLAPQAGQVKDVLMVLAADFSGAMRRWLQKIERDWTRELAPLHHGRLDVAAQAVKATPVYYALSLFAVANVRQLGNGESPLGILSDANAAVATVGAVLAGKNPWAYLRTSPRPANK